MIDKLLELRSGLSSDLLQFESTPSLNSNEPTIQRKAPMTPQKKLDMCLPIVNTPGSSALIKSIVQSARKTGLNSSPIRIPFAMSPMAARLQNARIGQIQFSPIKSALVAKEPSLPIKEAFLSNFEGESDEDCERENESITVDYVQEAEARNEDELVLLLPFNNKRTHEIEIEEDEEHQSKREKLDETDFKAGIDSIQNPLVEELDHSSNSNNSFLSNTSSPITTDISAFPISSFSSDLLTNLMDPELTSPELNSAIDSRVSRSENQDQRGIISVGGSGEIDGNDGYYTANPQVISKSSSTSSANSNSSGSHPLLPSGIIKLLEKKRLEKAHQVSDQPQSQPQSTSTSISSSSSSKDHLTSKKKFDLKESLKRSLPYKPHIGSMNPKNNKPPKNEF